jgi:hypothetical protein
VGHAPFADRQPAVVGAAVDAVFLEHGGHRGSTLDGPLQVLDETFGKIRPAAFLHGALHSVTFDPVHIIAVDWSGAVVGAHKRIWLAEATPERGLVHLQGGWTRAALGEHLLTHVTAQPRTVVGLDFAFSMPVWFLRELGVQSGPALWARVAECGEDWLRACAPPFWGRRGRSRPSVLAEYRLTEQRLRTRGVWPKSVFQIGGAGAVGTGSIRGMPLLHRLHSAGASIWPFDPPGWPRVDFQHPRLLTGAVVKSSTQARRAYIAEWFPELAEWSIPSEDAFDAAVSAVVMARCAQEFEALPEEHEAVVRLEGKIWQPNALDWPRGSGAADGR